MPRPLGSKFSVLATLSLLYCLFLAIPCFALPDPRDSIIIESKMVISGASPVYVRVYITNKDTLSSYFLALAERSISGGAYMILGQPREYGEALRPLDSTLQFFSILADPKYNNIPPDTFSLQGIYNPVNLNTAQRPNLVRKAIAEIKFDSVRGDGMVEFDSVYFRNPVTGGTLTSGFTDLRTNYIRVNFKKGSINVRALDLDLTRDGILNLYDVAVALNCLFLGTGNCPGISTPADITNLLNAVFSTNYTAPVEAPERSGKAIKPVENPERSRGIEK